MGWETRRGKRVYYRKVREGSRVRSIYCGAGERGELAAHEDAERRAANRSIRVAHVENSGQRGTTFPNPVDEGAPPTVEPSEPGRGCGATAGVSSVDSMKSEGGRMKLEEAGLYIETALKSGAGVDASVLIRSLDVSDEDREELFARYAPGHSKWARYLHPTRRYRTL